MIGHPNTAFAAVRRQAAIADYISRCDDALQKAIEEYGGAYPDWLIVPFSAAHTASRAALQHWLAELRANSGKIIRIYFTESAAPAD